MSGEAKQTLSREAIAVEHTLADVRLILWFATVAVAATFWIESPVHIHQVVAMAAFLVYCVAMWAVIKYRPWKFRTAAAVSSFLEVFLITGLIAAWSWTGPIFTRSPFYLWYVFYVASISLRYGMQMSILSLSASVVMYTAVSFFAPAKFVYSAGFMGDTGFLFVLAFMFGHIAERQRSYQKRLAVVNELGVELASLSTSKEIVNLLVTETMGLVGASKCWFASGRQNGESFNSSDSGDEWLSEMSLSLGMWSPAEVMKRREALVSNNPKRDPRLPKDVLEKLGLKSLAAVPLWVRDVPVGVLYVADKEPRGFGGYDLELLELIAAQAAPIIENVQLWERLKEAAAGEERLRIARDLHDNFLQTLSALKLYLERCRLVIEKDPVRAKGQIDRMLEISTEGLGDVRSYLSQLRLVGPEPSKFGQAAERCSAEAAVRGGFAVHTDIRLSEECITPEISLAAFQILRELLNNVVKHAEAANVWVTIRTAGDRLEMCVRDDGRGFEDQSGIGHEEGHLGLVGVKERLEEIGGDIRITSRIGEGTEVVVTIPTSACSEQGGL